MRAWLSIVVALFTAVVFACGSEADDGRRRTGSGAPGGPDGTSSPQSNGAPSGLPCNVDKVFRDRCQTCHSATPAAGASISLVTHADLQKDVGAGKKAYELVNERIHDEARIMPPKPSKLSVEELATLEHWIDQGAPSSTDTCNLPPGGSPVKPLSCTPDLVLKASKSTTLPTPSPSDVYMCFGATVNVDKKRHITAFAPHVDNAKILHHILLFKSPTPMGPDPVPCSAFGSAAWQLIAGWAPGGDNFEMPAEAGFPEEVGPTNWILQIHYNSGGGKYAGEVDQSGYSLCTTDQLRKNDAGVAGFGTLDVALPPRSKLTYTCNFPVTPEWYGKKFFSAFPHMHLRGTAMSSERLGIDGKNEMISSNDNYDYNNQATFTTSVTVNAGDTIRTKCSYKNPTDGVVLFGENTDNEMCFNFLGYYPAIPGYSWLTPSAAPCMPEVGGL
jgi:hypothetical protein